MEQRQHGQHALLRAHVDPRLQLVCVGHQVEVRQHDALGDAGRAAAVDEHRHVVGRHRLRLPVGRQRLLEQRPELNDGCQIDAAHHAVLAETLPQAEREGQEVSHRTAHDVAQRRLAHQWYGAVKEHGDRDDHLGAGVGEVEGQLALGVQRVERHDHRAGLEDAVIGDDELRRVGQEQRHPVAFAHASRLQSRGKMVGGLPDISDRSSVCRRSWCRARPASWRRCRPAGDTAGCADSSSAAARRHRSAAARGD